MATPERLNECVKKAIENERQRVKKMRKAHLDVKHQETHDIDWFFRYKGKVYHAASNGGMLPDKVDSLKNRMLQEKIEEMQGVYKVEMTENSASQGENMSSFSDYAKKGFISLDRMDNDGDKVHYKRIAFPVNNEMFRNKDLLDLMPQLDDGEIVIIE